MSGMKVRSYSQIQNSSETLTRKLLE